MNPSRFSSVTTHWAVLNNVEKFTLYLRWSIYCGLVMFLIMCLAPAFYFIRENGWQQYSLVELAVCFFALIINFVVAIITVGQIPELNTRKTSDVVRFKFLGISLVIATEILAAVAIWLFPAAQNSDMVAAVSFFAFVCFGFIYSTLVRFAWGYSLFLALVVLILVDHEYLNSFFAVMLWSAITVSTSRTSVWSAKMVKELDRARGLEALVHINEERLRFAGELHDTLGQQLAALSVKTELAIALEKKHDPRLSCELADIQQLIRETREEMRRVVAGHRIADPHRELQGAQGLLESMAITCMVNGDLADLPPESENIVGWFLREATTNLLKHAMPTWVIITITADSVTITNNGATITTGKFSGLDTLDQRARKFGGKIMTRKDSDEFAVTLKWGGD